MPSLGHQSFNDSTLVIRLGHTQFLPTERMGRIPSSLFQALVQWRATSGVFERKGSSYFFASSRRLSSEMKLTRALNQNEKNVDTASCKLVDNVIICLCILNLRFS